MNVAWSKIDRAMPYIGWLSSDSGQVDLTLRDGQQDIKVATKVYQHEQTLLPAGQYLATLNVKDNILNVPSFNFAAQKGVSQVRLKFYYLPKTSVGMECVIKCKRL